MFFVSYACWVYIGLYICRIYIYICVCVCVCVFNKILDTNKFILLKNNKIFVCINRQYVNTFVFMDSNPVFSNMNYATNVIINF
jgi:hypothetical protein